MLTDGTNTDAYILAVARKNCFKPKSETLLDPRFEN